jgi:hypothetical protein
MVGFLVSGGLRSPAARRAKNFDPSSGRWSRCHHVCGIRGKEKRQGYHIRAAINHLLV